jgi:adenylate cyclase
MMDLASDSPGDSLLHRLADLVAAPGDDAEAKLRKALLVRVSFLVILAGALWGVLYFVYGEPLAGAIPLSYSTFSLLTFVGFLLTRRYELYRSAQLVLILLLPFLLMVALGGYVNSSAVVLWSLLCPMAALVFDRPERAPRWMLMYIGFLVLGSLLQPYARQHNNLPHAMIVPLFFMLNIGAVSGIAFFLLYYFVKEKDRAYRLLNAEQERSEKLLLNVLPAEIAPRLKENEGTIADNFECASVLFADIVGSTPLFSQMEPREIVDWLNEVFSAFDTLVERYGLEKIRTIGDNYMVASGAPRRREDHAQALARMALEMCERLDRIPARNGRKIAFRMGINSGPMVGGVIGKTKFHYDLWGDTVNIASRMESQGEIGKIQVSEATYALLKDEFHLEPRGIIQVKGRGEMPTWYLTGVR